ncbi:hypothetical protein [Ramlibacter sp.]|uniref:hypothetical protein n=1 Tax=Ramlibacter sp. TaxID=1917967 RepID=UPI002627A669|nr:hypothetical protein [Ramlibacter sp.]MDB5957527.1 hypothetical protein [Ramlibacter sp.]
MAHRHSVLPRKVQHAAQPAGLWIVDAETTHSFELEAGSRSIVIPAGRTVESLMEAVSQSLDAAVAKLRQMRSGPAGSRGAASREALDGVVALLQQAHGINAAAYETLVETAIALGQR